MQKNFGRGERAGGSGTVEAHRRKRARAGHPAAGALLLIAASLSACGSDDASPAVTSDIQSQSPAPDPSAPAAPMDPEDPAPAGAEPASPEPGLGESAADEMLPLEPSAMQGEGAAPSDVPADEPPASEPSEAEPAPPAAFSPCPADGSPCRIMPLGDSITDGIGSANPDGGYRVELFRQAAAGGHAITFVGRQANGPANVDGEPFPRSHEGYSGATIATGMNQLANRVDAALAANPAHIILLHIGTNDIYQGMPASLPGQLGALLDQITEGAPDALVVVAQITPVAEAGAPFVFPNNGVDEYNLTIPGVVQERVAAGKHLLLVDMNTAFRAASDNFVGLLAEGLHPNNAGYAAMAAEWYAAIERFLP